MCNLLVVLGIHRLESPRVAFAFALVDTLERLLLDPMAFLIPSVVPSCMHGAGFNCMITYHDGSIATRNEGCDMNSLSSSQS